MRIRKRQVPFPLSSLSPVPLSDPHFSLPPVVQLSLHNNNNNNNHLNTQPSDQPNQLIKGGSDASVVSKDEKKEVLLIEEEEVKGNDERRIEGEGSCNDTRSKSILGANIDIGNLPQSSSSLQGVGRWCEGEKAFPLKKRRGSFERRGNGEEDKKTRSKMKTKMNKKCVQQIGNEQEGKETKQSSIVDSTSAKKKGRGGALMEGSRCSRVNGRGWRCCQQTLVGYSLCEHHLGKGRLRSMTSVRSRSLANAATKKDKSDDNPLSNSSSLQEKQPLGGAFLDDNVENYNQEEDEKPLMSSKKRMKLGMVKARSISSLLGQTDSAIAETENNK
ncbi:WRC domain-containing protein [Cephalotus follicularis]|uniref:WRC domain-containing protein n=1 Tax=Cephalotus follicularis TaxID=3775 RepID=A0A1Q3B7F2_CEPFO|nr:WRC domain-containing protein [Cephalotus follicularis]